MRSRNSSRCSSGVSPSGERSLSPVSTFWASTAPRTWKNSSRLCAAIARNLARSSTGHLLVRGQRQDAPVEVQPGDVAVEVARRAECPRRCRSCSAGVAGSIGPRERHGGIVHLRRAASAAGVRPSYTPPRCELRTPRRRRHRLELGAAPGGAPHRPGPSRRPRRRPRGPAPDARRRRERAAQPGRAEPHRAHACGVRNDRPPPRRARGQRGGDLGHPRRRPTATGSSPRRSGAAGWPSPSCSGEDEARLALVGAVSGLPGRQRRGRRPRRRQHGGGRLRQAPLPRPASRCRSGRCASATRSCATTRREPDELAALRDHVRATLLARRRHRPGPGGEPGRHGRDRPRAGQGRPRPRPGGGQPAPRLPAARAATSPRLVDRLVRLPAARRTSVPGISSTRAESVLARRAWSSRC